ncbi:autotransporter outer membrane beta-barrel domain-containing protein [Dyella koreensis]|uniref:Autotransporter outer membrane beta-barrel domain-containing protein n=1 Tax=Dyella koreensis TaxID=311235 RepID=A0ABW8K5G8_9GAMM
MSVAVALTSVIVPPQVGATVYTQPLTGVAGHDVSGGTGGYNPGYAVTSNGNMAAYTLLKDDAIQVESADPQVYGVAITSSSSSTTLDTSAGGVSISATRDVPTSGTNAGSAVGVYVSSPQSDPKSVTINGPINVSAVDRNSWTQRVGGTVYGNAYALWADDYGSLTINGDTTLKASTPGYGRVIYLTGNGSRITINGNLTAESDSNSTNYAIEGDGRSILKITGNVGLIANGVYPSDNVNGIWNPSVSARTEIDGNLNLYAIAHGSTVMGIRNNGNIYVGGSTSITAIGNRSAFAVNAGHRLSKTEFHGDTTLSAQGGRNTYGDTVGAYNHGGNGGNGYMSFDGNLTITARNGTFEGDSDVYGLNNDGQMSLTTAGTTTRIQATGTQGSHAAYGINNTLSFASASDVAITVAEVAGTTYGVANTGMASFNGGLSIAKAPDSTAATHYGVVTHPSASSSATTDINQGKSSDVTIQGDVLTGSNSGGYTGTLNLNLDTSKSWLNGLVLGDTDGSVGKASVAVSNGASWIISGTGTVSSDFGSGGLDLGSGGSIDMAAGWGAFAPGSVPSYSLRTLQVGSSATGGASVNLADGAAFTLISDVRNAQADKVVFGSGIASFHAQGTQNVRIAYDPVLSDTSWINTAALQKGVSIAAPSPIVIVDASTAASGTARFLAASGLTGQWSGTYENALVRFSYVPQIRLSSDSKQILLTGIDILGDGSGTTSSGGMGTSAGSGTPAGTGGTSSTSGTGTTSGTPSTGTPSGVGASGTASSPNAGNGAVTTGTVAIAPSTGVLVAGDAALALSNLWQIDERAVSRRSEAQRMDESVGSSAFWIDADNGNLKGDGSEGRTYRQNTTSTTAGTEWRIDMDQGRTAVGLAYTHVQSRANLQNGAAELRGDSVGLYGTWNTSKGLFADAVARVGRLDDNYTSRDTFGITSGRNRARAASVAVRAGRRFEGRRGGYIEPQVQAAYGSVGPSAYTASNRVRFEVDRNHTFLARAGVLFGKTLFLSPAAIGDVYARVSMVHTIGNRPDITASLDGGALPVALPTRHATTRELAVGGRVAAEAWSAFVEAGHASRTDALAGGWRAAAGVRVRF